MLIQTYNPAHYSLANVRTHDAAAFNERELAARADSGSPPFSSQTLIWVSGPALGKVVKLARQVAGKLRERRPPAVEVLGPVTAPISKLQNRYRWMILLKAKSVGPIHQLLRAVFDDSSFRVGSKERIAVDVDPYHVM